MLTQPALRLAPHLPLFHAPLVVVDVETTGLSPACDRVVELCAARFENERPPRMLDTIIDPKCPVGPTFIHGIRDSDVAGAPTFAEVAPALGALLRGGIMVAHNASFDQGFLSSELTRLGGRWGHPVLCTMRLSRRLHPNRRGRGSNTLDALSHAYLIHNPCPHQAAGDVVATAGLLACLLEDAARAGLHPMREVQPGGLSRWPRRRSAPRLKPRAIPRRSST